MSEVSDEEGLLSGKNPVMEVLITDAKDTLLDPVLVDCNFESGAKFWCYFCAEEFEKHERLQEFTVKFSGLLQHIASKSHSENTSKFLRNNAVWEKTTKPDFILDEAIVNSYKEKAITTLRIKEKECVQQRCQLGFILEATMPKAVVQQQVSATLASKMHTSLSFPGHEMLRIRQQEQTRHFIHQSAARESERSTIRYASHSQNASAMAADVGVQDRIKGRRTIGAFAEGLTYVQPKSTGDVSGNIFTGAVPPWMKQTGQDDTSSHAGSDVNLSHNASGVTQDIGPSLDEYEKHLAREKKGKLPATRVGATFDHKVDTSAHWLPSFGRVWSKNRRANAKQQFQFHLKQGSTLQKGFPRQQRPSSSASGSGCSISHVDTDSRTTTKQHVPDINHVVPYKRKRVTSPVHTAAASSSNLSTQLTNPMPLNFIQSNPVYSSQQPIRSSLISGMNCSMNKSGIQTPVINTGRSFVHDNVNRGAPSSGYTPLSKQNLISHAPVRPDGGMYGRTITDSGVFNKASQSNKPLPSQTVDSRGTISLIRTPLLNKK